MKQHSTAQAQLNENFNEIKPLSRPISGGITLILFLNNCNSFNLRSDEKISGPTTEILLLPIKNSVIRNNKNI